jgi:hypothetical protein
MLGGGNPVSSSNPAGTGTSINYIGNHAYAHSGLITCNTNFTKLLKFTLGNSYVKMKFYPVYFTEGTGEDCFWQILIDGETIYHTEITSSSADTPYQEVEFILPAYATIEVQAKAASGTRNLGAVMSGRVYN